MKNAKPLLSTLAISMWALAFLSGSTNSMGQTAQTFHEPSLYAENSKSHRQIAFVVGKTLRFKTTTSNNFEKGRLTGFTDSTISLSIRKQGNATYRFKELTKLQTPKIPGRMVAKTVVILAGVAMIVVDAGNSLANEGKGGGTISGFGLVAIAGGIAISGMATVNLLESWSLKTANANALARDSIGQPTAPSNPATAYKKYILGLGIGYAGKVDQSDPSSGIAFYVEPRYMFSSSLGIGFQIAHISESESITSFSLNGRYYLGEGDVRPFLGVGVGYYMVSLNAPSSVSSYSTFGVYPRVGIEFKRVNLTVDYNKLPDQMTETSVYFPGNPGFWANIPSSKEYSYLSVTVGISLGGGK